MIKSEVINLIDLNEFDRVVEETYGRPYSFQQQDGCKGRGIFEFFAPVIYPYDYEEDEIPEEINGEKMGVSFKAWLARDPKQKLESKDDWARNHGLSLFWARNFYPSVDMIINDLHGKGLIPSGKYAIKIDW